MKAMPVELAKEAKSQMGCTTCALGCPTAKSVKEFPKNIQYKIDWIVAKMNRFRKLCEAKNINCNHGKEPKLTKEVLDEFVSIVKEYQSFVLSQGKIYPNLKESLDYILTLHANDVFEYLARKARK